MNLKKKNRLFFALIFVVSILFRDFCLSGCNSGKEAKKKNNSYHHSFRIVSLVPSVTEIIFMVGAGKNVVGVCNQCRWPPETAKLVHIGSYLDASAEAILKLEPDIVFLYETQVDVKLSLEKNGVVVRGVKTENISDVYATILKVSKDIGKKSEGEKLVNSIKGEIEKIGSGSSHSKVKTVVVVDRMPFSLERIFVAGGKGYIGEILKLGGGLNCFEDAKLSYPMVSLEAIAACKAEVLIDIRPPQEAYGMKKERGIELWKKAGFLSPDGTIRKLEIISTEPVSVPGPRVVESIKIIRKILMAENYE